MNTWTVLGTVTPAIAVLSVIAQLAWNRITRPQGEFDRPQVPKPH